MMIDKAVGWITCTVSSALQPLTSVTVTGYVPAESPLTVSLATPPGQE